MRPVNLIPPEDRRGDRAPMRAGPLAYAVVGALLLLFVGVYALVSTGNSISERKAEVATLEQQLASSQARADGLQSFSSFASLEQSRTLTVTTLARSRFDWERVMRELALVIPGDVSLTSLTGAVTPEVSAATGSSSDSGAQAAQGIQAPTLAIMGCASSHESVARLVASLRDIDGVTRVGLGSSTAGTTDGSAEGAVATGGTEGGSACPDPDAATFEVTVAFDEVEISTAAPPAPAPGLTENDGAGVAEAEQDGAGAQESVESAGEQSQEAVDRYVPGA